MAKKTVQEKRLEDSQKISNDEEASKFADAQAKPGKDNAAALKALESAVAKAREAGLDVAVNVSFVEENVSHNKSL